MARLMPDEQKVNEGRYKAVNWDALFTQWVTSSVNIKEFLLLSGVMRPGERVIGTVWRRTKDWPQRRNKIMKVVSTSPIGEGILDDAAQAPVLEAQLNPVPSSSSVVDDADKRADDIPKAIPIRPATNQSAPEQPDTWNLILSYRRKQSLTDHKSAEVLRNHIHILMRNSFGKDAEGRPITKLKPAELRSLALALRDIQTVQRLSLGLSTENIGIDGDIRQQDDAPNVEKVIAEELDSTPTFEVQMSRRGRFITPRPRRIS